MIIFTDCTMLTVRAEFTNNNNLHDHPWGHRNTNCMFYLTWSHSSYTKYTPTVCQSDVLHAVSVIHNFIAAYQEMNINA